MSQLSHLTMSHVNEIGQCKVSVLEVRKVSYLFWLFIYLFYSLSHL